MAVSTIVLAGQDGAGNPITLRAEQRDTDNSVAIHSVIEVAGSPVNTGNPLPVSAAQSTGNYLNGSVTLSTASTQVLAAASRVRVKLVNNSGVGTAGGAAVVIWCRWGATPVAGGVGSFALQPNGGGIDDQGPGVNQLALNCLAESGTPNLYVEQY